MFEVELEEGFSVTVDEATASQLQDPSYAKQYTQIIKDAIGNNGKTEETESTLWKTRQATTIDQEATLAFLALRQTYGTQFEDKKICNNTLWGKIRDSLNEMGYFVGVGIAGREKCRQKFANLQSSYFRTKERRKRTGEGKVQDCPYFKEMDAILGDKHKTQPVLVLDSLEQPVPYSPQSPEMRSDCNEVISVENETTSRPSTSTCSESSLDSPKGIMENRFKNLKSSVKPVTQRNKALEELISIQKENQAERKNEFKTMIEMLAQQCKQQHEKMMALIAAMSPAAKKQKTDENE